ncbi:MAG TPA: hypothetical protein DD732_01110 [Rhizobiales bacterium]|jgi:uncharacterized membrane protein|nr:hypothetical protein [Hyphomicrobiales bacterium]HBR25630.1 hypothetical protein [Hyphomicrobiales bacterium]
MRSPLSCFQRRPCLIQTGPLLQFATWILLALEFALAADLVRTAVAPTWDDISKLAVIATIRTMLNYFLAKDIADFSAAKQSAGTPPPG